MSMESAEGAVALAEMPRPDAYPEAHDCTARPEIGNERQRPLPDEDVGSAGLLRERAANW